MSTFRKAALSGSTNGRPIKVTDTGVTGADIIHTAQAGTGIDNFDEIYIWANNTSGVDAKLTILWGGITDPDDIIEVTIAFEAGLNLIIPGFVLQNSLVVKAYAGTADVINITGFVNRITA